MEIFYVFIGGGLGSVLRYFLSPFNVNGNDYIWPVGTFLVNLLSSFFLGFLMQKALSNQLHPSVGLLLATGFCGGFSTFSTFSYELYLYFQKGEFIAGMLYISLSIILGIILIWAGFKIAQ